MKKNKILIVGASGLIGQSIVDELGRSVDWVGTSTRNDNDQLIFLDVLNEDSLDKVFKKVQPTAVIHCANLRGGVVFCEKNPDLASKTHYQATCRVGEYCLKYHSRFLYISTECVFDGKKESYIESDPLSPINVYGRCKADSEIWIQKNLKDHVIVRTMSVFGWQPATTSPNALMKAYFSIRDKEKFFVPAYRWVTPTYVRVLARAIVELILSSYQGIIHVAGETYISRYDWVVRSCQTLGLDTSYILPQNEVSSFDVPYPMKIRLDTKKFRSEFKTKLLTLSEALEQFKKDKLNYEKSA